MSGRHAVLDRDAQLEAAVQSRLDAASEVTVFAQAWQVLIDAIARDYAPARELVGIDGWWHL